MVKQLFKEFCSYLEISFIIGEMFYLSSLYVQVKRSKLAANLLFMLMIEIAMF